jgi:hypothetical protein
MIQAFRRATNASTPQEIKKGVEERKRKKQKKIFFRFIAFPHVLQWNSILVIIMSRKFGESLLRKT